jgi:hypothetical protein
VTISSNSKIGAANLSKVVNGMVTLLIMDSAQKITFSLFGKVARKFQATFSLRFLVRKIKAKFTLRFSMWNLKFLTPNIVAI